MDLKDLLSDLIAGGLVQKHYVFIQKLCAFSEFLILSHYSIKSGPLDWLFGLDLLLLLFGFDFGLVVGCCLVCLFLLLFGLFS